MSTPRTEPKIDKDIIRTAVCAAERFRYHIPFETISDAKALVKSCCEANNFDYNLPSDTPPAIKRAVADRVHFFVALNACNRGEFHIETPFLNPQKLREAVEADVARVLPLIPSWSRKFPSVRLAADWVARQCAEHKFSYAAFGGIEAGRFQGYVHFNVVRQAYEAGKVNLVTVPRDWFKKVTLKPGASLRDTIEADIDRLTPLLPPWPAFSSINAARNHVSRFCARTRFQYIGWGKIEPQRYRMWVNYHTAKRAYDAGRIAMGPWAVLDEANLVEANKADHGPQSRPKQLALKLVQNDDYVDEVDLYEDLMEFSDEPWFVSSTGVSTPSRSRASTPRRPSTPLKTLMD